MAEKEKKIKVDYHHLTVEKLAELIAELGDKAKDFNASAYVGERAAETKLIDVVNADGKPKYYIGKDGKTKIKKKRVTIGSEKVKYFNLMKAKKDFYKMFKDEPLFEWDNVPKTAAKEDKTKKVAAALAAMGVSLD